MTIKSSDLSFLLLAIIVFITPIISSTLGVYALLATEIMGCALLIISLWRPQNFLYSISNSQLFLIIFLIVTPLFYLIPIPYEIWIKLPGREAFSDSVEWLQNHTGQPVWLTISLVPQKTVHSLIALIPVIAVFIATIQLDKKHTLYLAHLILIAASLQAMLGIIQFSNQNADWAYFNITIHSGHDAQGLYGNRNHFAALMYMALPLGAALIASHIKNHNSHKPDGLGYGMITLFLTLIIIIFIAGILSRSRAGITLLLLCTIISLILFSYTASSRRSNRFLAALLPTITFLLFSIGLTPVLNRFLGIDPTQDARWGIFENTIMGIKQFFPIGTGPGTFQEIYRNLQSIEQLKFINRAHNDYLELVLETGVIGIGIIATIGGCYLANWLYVLKKAPKKDQTHLIQIAAGISMFLIFAHALVEFNFHSLANAAIFTALAGIFFNKYKKSPT